MMQGKRLHDHLMSIFYWNLAIKRTGEESPKVIHFSCDSRVCVLRFVLVLFIYILRYGVMTEYNLKYKIPKCLLYLKNSINRDNLQDQCQYAWDLVNWLYNLRAITLIADYKTNKINQLSLNQITKIFKHLTTLTNTVGKQCYLGVEWNMVNIYIKGRYKIWKHMLPNEWFDHINKLPPGRKREILIKRFQVFVDSVSMFGNTYRNEIKKATQREKNAVENAEIIQRFLGLTKEKKSIFGFKVHPFALKNLCCLKECWLCHKKTEKLRSITNNGVNYFFCSDKCKFVSFYCRLIS